MKTAFEGIVSLALFVLLHASVFAQSGPPVTGATLVGTYSVHGTADNGHPYLDQSTDSKEFIVEGTAWLVGGETIISLNLNTMAFPEDCDWAETIAISTLVHEAAVDGIRRAIELGYVLCSSSCPSGSSIKVYYPTCVNRNINGSCPVLTAEPSSDFSYNTYDVCCEGGSPTITLISKTCGSSNCGTGYQRTCGS